MTRVQVQYELDRPPDKETMRAIAAAHGVYGIGRIVLEPGPRLRVDYDASRLSAAEVEAALRSAGIAVRA
jgi:hypothetical protein